jgi:outer membrane protein OmpA-like peptidoglycan-associated protein
MTPPRIDAGSTTTVSPIDAGTPDATVPSDASARPDVSTRTDASPPADAGAPPDAGRTTPPSPSRDAGAADALLSSRSPWTIELDGFVGPGRLGGPNGTLFSPDFSPANEGWNHTRVGIGGGFTYRLWNPIPQFELGFGARLGYFNLSGDRHTPGRLDGADLSAHVDARFPILDWLVPDLRISAAALLATGETTANDSFSVDHTGGVGVALRAQAGIGFRIGEFTITPSFYAETGVIPNARGNAAAPWVDLGGLLLAGYTPGAPAVVRTAGGEFCTDGVTEETPTSINRRVETLRGAIATLRRENEELRTRVHEAHPDLNLDEIDGLQSVEATRVPDPLPTNCAELLALKNAMENERDALDRQNGLLEGVRRAPAAAAHQVVRVITRLQEIHFITARPQGAPDRVTEPRANIATLDQARNAYVAAHPADGQGNREPIPMDQIETLFAAIFPRSERQDGTTYSPNLAALQQIATSLHSPTMRGYRLIVVGNTDSRGDEAMNMRLSLRRAQAIRNALIFMGVNPDVIIPVGRGPNNLVYYHDQRRGSSPHALRASEIRMLQRDGVRGQALEDEIRGRQSTNRRTEGFICGPDSSGDDVCTELLREAAPSSAAPQNGAGAPIQQVPPQTR